MIGYVVGHLTFKSAPILIVETSGVGYEISAPLSTFSALPALGEKVKLLTHFVVREDAQLLFGFAEETERKLFRSLIKVNGVGPKLALAILSGMDVAGFRRCVLGGDVKSLTALPGVGKKTAERLIVDMKDCLSEWQEAELPAQERVNSGFSQAALIAEAETALVALGYKPTEASKAVQRVDLSSMDSAESLIRAALKATLA